MRKMTIRGLYPDELAKEFNTRHGIGVRVRYWPIVNGAGERSGDPLETRTRSDAWVDLSGNAVIILEGKEGCVALRHVEVLDGGMGDAR